MSSLFDFLKTFRNQKKIARSTPLGLPGGPCHILRTIEEDKTLSPRLKEELSEDVEKGRDLDNKDAYALYDRITLPLPGLESFKDIELTAHAQYRMDLRGVTIPELKLALEEIDKWFTRQRKSPPEKIKAQDRNLLIDMAQGSSVRFEARKIGLTVVFSLDTRTRKLSLVSTWWTDVPNPPKPRPGECDIIPFLDSRTPLERPAILGSRAKATISLERVVKAYLGKTSSVNASRKNLERRHKDFKVYNYLAKPNEDFSSITYASDALVLLNSNLVAYLRSK